ncbi:MAG TPA: DnaJ domain-containing protein [Candidatus Limnocylindrales bacterium]|jgi:curved DNA-binding protein CbpA
MTQDPRYTYYAMLMLAENADAEIISTVYRKLAQRFHPDVDTSAEAARRMSEINDAYATLRDAEKRRKYDAWLKSRRDRRKSDRMIIQQGDLAYGSAGVPDGPPAGSLLEFGRYQGWTIGQVRRRDPEYLEWLMRVPIGQRYRDEIGRTLAQR